MPFLIRKIIKQDFDALISFFDANKNSKFFDPFPLDKRAANLMVNPKNRDLFYAVFADNQIVGLGMLRWYGNYKSPTLGLIVDKNFRGLGMGHQIYEYLFDRTREVGAKEVISIVYKDNKVSAHIAKKLGMTELKSDSLSFGDRYDFRDYSLKHRDKIILIKMV